MVWEKNYYGYTWRSKYNLIQTQLNKYYISKLHIYKVKYYKII